MSQKTVTRGQLLRPYPHFGNLTIFNPTSASSTYHGFTLKAERRFSSGLGFLVSYTAAKNISDAPATVGPSADHQNAYDRRSDRSLVEEDIAQRLVLSGSWQLPFGRGRQFGTGWNRALEALLGGWQLNSIVSVQSGTPLVITNTPNTARALGGGQRPNSNGFSAAKSGRIQDRLDSYMDAFAFSAPEPFTFGTLGVHCRMCAGHGIAT
ncbi:MAG: hypothetical protein ACRD7E_15040 [Bryobacteraceae bacterium]